jgi:type III pantothenate kinase
MTSHDSFGAASLILVVDIGNTNIKLSLFNIPDNLREGFEKNPIKLWTISSTLEREENELDFLFKGIFKENNYHNDIKGVIIGSVKPDLNISIIENLKNNICNSKLDIVQVKGMMNLPIDNCCSQPERSGADRIANAVGAYQLYKRPAIVVDIGTATTIEVIDQNNKDRFAYFGGAIMPGPQMALNALTQGTALLKNIKAQKPQQALGRNTADAISTGIYYGTIGSVNLIIEKIVRERELKMNSGIIIITGGRSREFYHEIKNDFAIEVIHMPTLTLFGLAEIWRYTKIKENNS